MSNTQDNSIRRRAQSRNTFKITSLKRNRSVEMVNSQRRLTIPDVSPLSRSLTDLTVSTDTPPQHVREEPARPISTNIPLIAINSEEPQEDMDSEGSCHSLPSHEDEEAEKATGSSFEATKNSGHSLLRHVKCGAAHANYATSVFYTDSSVNKPDEMDSARCQSILSVDTSDSDISDAELLDEKILYKFSQAEAFSDSENEQEEETEIKEKNGSDLRQMIAADWKTTEFIDNTHKVVFELFTSERSYVERLTLLNEIREETIVSFGEKVADTMFSGITKMCYFHIAVLLPKIKERVTNWAENPSIGDVMTNCCSLLNLYKGYILGLDAALVQIGKYCKQHIQYAAKLRHLRNKYGTTISRLSIESHMTEPMQRIPRYELLLKEYLRKIPEDSADRLKTEVALKYVTDAAMHVNRMSDKQIKLKELIQIQDSLVGRSNLNIISSERELVYRDSILKMHDKSGKAVMRYAFLFTDMMILSVEEKTVKKFIVKDVISIKDVKLAERDSLDDEYSFIIITERKCWELGARTEKEKNHWVQIITETAEKHSGRNVRQKGKLIQQQSIVDLTYDRIGKQAPILVHFSDVSMCMRCANKFTFLKTKNHCKACGAVVCYNCAFRTMHLEYCNKEEKICDKCYVVFTEGHDRRVSTGLETSGPELIFHRYIYWTDENALLWRKRWFTVSVKGKVTIAKANRDVIPIKTMRRYHVVMIALSGEAVIRLRHRHQRYYLKDKSNDATKKCYELLTKYAVNDLRPEFVDHKEADISTWRGEGAGDARNILSLMTQSSMGQAGLIANIKK